jgi:hypothetical protein
MPGIEKGTVHSHAAYTVKKKNQQNNTQTKNQNDLATSLLFHFQSLTRPQLFLLCVCETESVSQVTTVWHSV